MKNIFFRRWSQQKSNNLSKLHNNNSHFQAIPKKYSMDLFKSMFLCFLIVLYQNLDAYGKPISSKCKSVDEDKLGNLSAFFSSLWSQTKITYNQTVINVFIRNSVVLLRKNYRAFEILNHEIWLTSLTGITIKSVLHSLLELPSNWTHIP